MPPHDDAKSTRRPDRARVGNPTALDVLFILLASVTLLLLLLWIVTTLRNQTQFAELPPWFDNSVSGVWKVLLGTGTAGTLALRKWLYQSRPSPNYLLWIPGFMALLIVSLFVLGKLVPTASESSAYHVPIWFTLESRTSRATAIAPDNEILFLTLSPERKNQVGLFPTPGQALRTYATEIDIPRDAKANFTAEINYRSRESNAVKDWQGYEYQICLKANAARLLPEHPVGTQARPVRLACANHTCPRTRDDPGYARACDEPVTSAGSIVSRLYAAEPPRTRQGLERGWVVPSLKTLNAMADRERVGFTRFTVAFTPAGKAVAADRYYFILRVNGQMVYIDGFRPERTTYPLRPGAPSEIAFALENLNFTGQYEGYERLHLTIVFLKGAEEVYREDAERTYVALRDAPEDTIATPSGPMRWSGTYVEPKNKNRYEILLKSFNCDQAAPRTCVDQSMNEKKQFDAADLKFNGRSVVEVVRPPVPPLPGSYGLALGVVQPTSQVQFTFNEEEAAQLCHWAVPQIGHGPGGSLIRRDLRRYEPETRGFAPCR